MVYAVKQFTVQDAEGNIIPSAQVTVTKESGGIATIYSDRAGTNVKANPFNADSNGLAVFYAPGGAYRIDVSGGGFSATYRYVAVGTAAESDADNYGQLTPTLRWQELVDISDSDLDDLTVNGFYTGVNLGNAPGGSSDGFYVMVLAIDSDWALQLAWRDYSSPDHFMRLLDNGSWSAWVSGAGVSTAIANLWTKQQTFSLATLTSGTNVAWDVDGAQVAILPLSHNATLDNMTNAKDGGVYILIVQQQLSGGRTLSYGTGYRWPDSSAPSLTTTQFGYDILTFIRHEGSVERFIGSHSGPYAP